MKRAGYRVGLIEYTATVAIDYAGKRLTIALRSCPDLRCILRACPNEAGRTRALTNPAQSR